MKKTYTRKQIQEAISYWRKQLRTGNYRKIGESLESEGAREDIESELAGRNDIPNYLKRFIRDEVLADAGTDGVGWHDWNLDVFAEDLLRDRVVEVDYMIWDDGNSDDATATRIPNDRLPLKFGPEQVNAELRRMFPDRKGLFASGISISFPEDDLRFYWESSGCFDDPQWRQEILQGGAIPVELDDAGDAERLYDGRIYTIDASGVVR